MVHSDPIGAAMHQAVEEGVFPGAVLMVSVSGRVHYQGAFGLASCIPDKSPAIMETIYDLASLTKPLATTTAVLCLVQEGALTLEDRVEVWLKDFKGWAVGSATIAHLLSHRSGLPGWRPFYQWLGLDPRELSMEGRPFTYKEQLLYFIRKENLIFKIGSKSEYSDLGFMLLGFIVEQVSGLSLHDYCQSRIFTHLKTGSLGFRPLGENSEEGVGTGHVDRRQVAPTEDDPWRRRIVRGEVHDENSFVLGGVAGHAGLFGNAAAVMELAGNWLIAVQGEHSILPPSLVRHCVQRQPLFRDSSWVLGWDTPSHPSSSGKFFTNASFGHLGFTGTSLWIDPTRDLIVVMLSNRVHPTRTNDKIRDFRPKIHDIIVEELCQDYVEGK